MTTPFTPLTELDTWLLREGTHLRPYEVLGAHPCQLEGADGVRFAVWSPNASRVSVVGDFNAWDGRQNPLQLHSDTGVWTGFVPEIGIGTRYKFEIWNREGYLLTARADPYARQSEVRPATASIVAPLPPQQMPPPERQHANALDAPMSIYEVHLGSWRRGENNRWLTWDEIADTLIPYVQDMGFTHIELLPISEHPFDGSWGYQPVGLYAPTSRFGSPDGLVRLVQRCHAAGIGVILDWVPAHFPTDAHGLAGFDGTHLYEHADPREGFHQDWNTLIYNLGRTEVANFLIGNALYWLERFGVDGLRVDAVASMLYRDYSRKAGEWVPNAHGGRENLEAIAFFKRLNEIIGRECPHAMTLAEESTAFPLVSHPTYVGGLGFHYKWNMGWMHDSLQYIQRDPIHRQYHQGEISFGLVYAFSEHFVLPISHDEVVHGKGSLLNKMSGDRWQKFANLRAYLGFMFTHPGKKLLFMGCEFAQEREWNHDQSLDWHLLENENSQNTNKPEHTGVQRLVRDLNYLYRQTPALHQSDCSPDGFEWIDHRHAQESVFSFIRRVVYQDNQPVTRTSRAECAINLVENDFVIIVCHFVPTVVENYRIGVPQAGTYRERLNTDSAHYGGSNQGTPFGCATAEPVPWNGQPFSIVVTLPPLATVVWECV